MTALSLLSVKDLLKSPSLPQLKLSSLDNYTTTGYFLISQLEVFTSLILSQKMRTQALHLPETPASSRERRTQRCHFCPLTPSDCSLSSVAAAADVDDNVHQELEMWSASTVAAVEDVAVPAAAGAAGVCCCNYDNVHHSVHVHALLMSRQCRSPMEVMRPGGRWWQAAADEPAPECQLWLLKEKQERRKWNQLLSE